MIRERGEKLNNEDINRVATEIKQKYGYVCQEGLLEEFKAFDNKLDKNGKELKVNKLFKKYTFESAVDKKVREDFSKSSFLLYD